MGAVYYVPINSISYTTSSTYSTWSNSTSSTSTSITYAGWSNSTSTYYG
jgi:hypothetical protein